MKVQASARVVAPGMATAGYVPLGAAWAALRSKNTYLSTQYHRLAVRRGGKRAAVAVAHSILVAIYHMLKTGAAYHELGGNYFDERDRHLVIGRAVKRIEKLGYKITLEAA